VSVIRSTAHTAAKLFAHRQVAKRLSVPTYTYYTTYLLLVHTMYVYNFAILCTVHDTKLLIYITTFTCPETYTHQTLVNSIHVSRRYGCRHQGVISFANIAPSKWSVAK